MTAWPDGSGSCTHLVDVAGFVTVDDTRVRGLAAFLGDAEVHLLGAYAVPFIDLSDTE